MPFRRESMNDCRPFCVESSRNHCLSGPFRGPENETSGMTSDRESCCLPVSEGAFETMRTHSVWTRLLSCSSFFSIVFFLRDRAHCAERVPGCSGFSRSLGGRVGKRLTSAAPERINASSLLALGVDGFSGNLTQSESHHEQPPESAAALTRAGVCQAATAEAACAQRTSCRALPLWQHDSSSAMNSSLSTTQAQMNGRQHEPAFLGVR